MAESTRRGVPEATVGRLPGYLRVLLSLRDQGRRSVSSEEMATLAGVRSAQVRKDLSQMGSYGVRGVGYDVARLSDQISAELGLSQDWPVVIVGIGNLGRALASYQGLAHRGFRVVALADEDPAVVGTRVGDLVVQRLDSIDPVRTPVAVGIIATPAAAAQGVADTLVRLGVHSVLNLSPCLVTVPDGVDVRGVDLATELQILAFHQHQRELSADTAPAEEVG
jgi:redox-sensing transcriptional repressor